MNRTLNLIEHENGRPPMMVDGFFVVWLQSYVKHMKPLVLEEDFVARCCCDHSAQCRFPSRWICHNALTFTTKVRRSKMSELFPDRVAYCKKLHGTVNSFFFIFGSYDGVLPSITYTSIPALSKYSYYCHCVVMDEAAYQRCSFASFPPCAGYPVISSTGTILDLARPG